MTTEHSIFISFIIGFFLFFVNFRRYENSVGWLGKTQPLPHSNVHATPVSRKGSEIFILPSNEDFVIYRDKRTSRRLFFFLFIREEKKPQIPADRRTGNNPEQQDPTAVNGGPSTVYDFLSTG